MAPARSWLEVFKFGVYVTVPIALTLAATQPESVEALVRSRAYVVYPPSGPTPPTAEQLRDIARRQK